MKKEEYFPQYWPEKCEAEREYLNFIPPWHVIESQGIVVRQTLMKARDEGDTSVASIGAWTPHRRSYGTVQAPMPIEKFDVHNIHAFQYLPCISQTRDSLTAALRRALKNAGHPETHVEQMATQFRNEMAHSMYHHAMWRRYGRRVYVLDQTTFTLLAETPLPPLPASILAMPEHSFYLKFPKHSFKFGVWDQHLEKEDAQPIEGVIVSMDNITPDSTEQRELAFIAAGEGSSDHDRNIAYISVALGPDGTLDEVRFGESLTQEKSLMVRNPLEVLGSAVAPDARFASSLNTGAYELGVIVPRVILGFLLYLQCEHPDIEPVAPAPRRHFKEVLSPKQRERALINQDLKLRGTTRLPILYVGRHLAQEVWDNLSESTTGHKEFHREEKENKVKIWELDHQVWVRGHWKQQSYGEGHKLRKLIWIKPYLKGPEMAEVLRARAAKVQQARPAKGDAIEVVPQPTAEVRRMKTIES